MKDMFCFQCQETINNTGCTTGGACGKTVDTANLQDILIYVSKLLASATTQLRVNKLDIDASIKSQILKNLFITITNSNFDDDSIIKAINKSINIINELKNKYSITINSDIKLKEMNKTELLEKSSLFRITNIENEDVRSLKELVTYGLKGMAAYLYHAEHLGAIDDNINTFLESSLSELLDNKDDANKWLQLVMETGKYGVEAMALLDEANTNKYGNPEISKVTIEAGNKPGILISGHDLKDLEILLEQTKDYDVDIYTHSEMLPANYYPYFKKYKNLRGNYGNAWWNQREEFEAFNGPILMTTNCIVPPLNSYKDRMFTTNCAGFSGIKHIEEDEKHNKNFKPIIELALKCQPPKPIEKGEILGGFAHNQVLALKDDIVKAVKNGKIKKFIVMAGCDGRHKSRSYYTDFAKNLPKDTVILTAGCAKYRYNKLNLGDIDGIPRVLDAGQCNDSYSLAIIALNLKEIFQLSDINDLPIAYNIAWYEQKAVIVLLALLYLGVKNIHLGPTLPSFLSENVVRILVDNFNISGISNVRDDIDELIFDKKVVKKEMLIKDIIKMSHENAEILTDAGMHCVYCPSSAYESLEEACMVHNMDLDDLLTLLNQK